MKNLNEPLENGLIPIVEIAKLIYNYDDPTEYDYVDFNKPEICDDGLFVSFCGDKNGTGITEYLYFDVKKNQFKTKVYDSFYTSDYDKRYISQIDYDPIRLINKLVDLGVGTYEEFGIKIK